MKVKAVFVLAILLSLFITGQINSQSRGLKVVLNALVGAEAPAAAGRQYAVLIAVDRYREWTPLRNPVRDARAIRAVLEKRYYIDESIELFDEHATAAGIRELFARLAGRLEPADSLFVYYAGHGQVDAARAGYLIPVDGGRNQASRENWLPNQEIRDYLGGIKARSVMLAADACFSGDMLNLTRGTTPEPNIEYFRKSLNYRARQVLTSGASESVPDESEFTRQFLAMLERNTEPYLDPITMFDAVRRGVTRSMPLLGSLPGHQDGGSFILFLKDGPNVPVPDPVKLRLTGLPPQTKVEIEGSGCRETGLTETTVWQMDLPPGVYQIRLSHALWKGTLFGKFNFEEDAEQDLTPYLGDLEVAAPEGAVVEINDIRVDQPPIAGRITVEGLKADEYRIKLSGEYIQSSVVTAVVAAKASVSVAPPFEILGRFSFDAPGPVRLELRPAGSLDSIARIEGTTGNRLVSPGTYQVYAGRPEDIDYSWRGTVLIQPGQTTPFGIPEAALSHSVAWRIRETESDTAILQARHAKAKAGRDLAHGIGLGGFITGGAGAVASGVFWLLGNAAMQDYRSAGTPGAASSARQSANMYSTLFNVSLAATGLGLATGGAAWVLTPETEKLSRELDVNLRKLAELQAEKEVQR